MRVQNIAYSTEHKIYELQIIGTEQEVEEYGSFTRFTADMIEEEIHDEYSITIISNELFITKKEFRAAVTAELKEFRKYLKNK